MYDYIHNFAILLVALLHLKNEFDKYKSNKIIEELNSELGEIQLKLHFMELIGEPVRFQGERNKK